MAETLPAKKHRTQPCNTNFGDQTDPEAFCDAVGAGGTCMLVNGYGESFATTKDEEDRVLCHICRFPIAHHTRPPAEPPLEQKHEGSAKLMLSPTGVLQQISPAADPFGIPGLRFTRSKPMMLTDANGLPIDRTQLVVRVPPLAETAWFGLKPPSQLWVRQHYFALWTALKKQLTRPVSSGLLVIGNPGIGKSVGGINTIAALSIEDDPNRLLVVVRDQACHIFMDGCWFEAPGVLPTDCVKATLAGLKVIAPRMGARARAQGLSEPQLLLLHDVKSAEGHQSFPYQSWFVGKLNLAYQVHCVVFATPHSNNCSQCEKDFSTVSRFYMPMWSLQELKEVEDGLNLSPTVDLVERFREVGGIVRRFADDSVLSVLKEDRAEALKSSKIEATFD